MPHQTKTKRRDFLKSTAVLSAQFIAGQMIVTSAFLRQALASASLPIQALIDSFGNDGSLVLVPSDLEFSAHQGAFNLRKNLIPQLRVLPVSSESVAKAIIWAKINRVPFAIRSGGHSYEGYSQSEGLVIDVRLLNHFIFDPDSQTVEVGAGATLGDIYHYLAQFSAAIPAGSCPSVGVAGHVLGGGFGLMARKYGLACDSVLSFEIVTSKGDILNVSATENSDLYWALRGGGNGNFGIVTKLTFQTYRVTDVATFGVSWILPIDSALKVFQAWQNWAPNAPDEITSIFHVSKAHGGLIALHCAGTSTQSAEFVGDPVDLLKRELKNLFNDFESDKVTISNMKFIESVRHFAGNLTAGSVYMKAKSSYLLEPMSPVGIENLMVQISTCPVRLTALFDSYGGKVASLTNKDTAFVHRENVLFVIQYYSEWKNNLDTELHLDSIRSVYNSMLRFVSKQSYVNYCDLDLVHYADAYWGENLPRLVRIKNLYDPTNFFHHAQSIPLRIT